MIYDITPEIDEKIAVWPGDLKFSRIIKMDTAQGDHLSLSGITTTLHLGAHADAPSHYLPFGQSIEKRCLEYYLGSCQVIRLCALQKPFVILPKHLHDIPMKAPRLLFSTGTFSDTKNWNNEFAYFSDETVVWLHQQGVKLVGIDTPSVDAFDSKFLSAHKRIAQFDMAILEGLDLSAVPEGLYELIALPLKLAGAEASPVRAILRTTSEDIKPN